MSQLKFHFELILDCISVTHLNWVHLCKKVASTLCHQGRGNPLALTARSWCQGECRWLRHPVADPLLTIPLNPVKHHSQTLQGQLVGGQHPCHWESIFTQHFSQVLEEIGGVQTAVIVQVKLGDKPRQLVELDQRLKAELFLFEADPGTLSGDCVSKSQEKVFQLKLEVGSKTAKEEEAATKGRRENCYPLAAEKADQVSTDLVLCQRQQGGEYGKAVYTNFQGAGH